VKPFPRKKIFLALLIVSFLTVSAAGIKAQEPAQKPASSTTSASDSGPEKFVANNEERDENEIYKHSASVKKLGLMLGLSTEQAATVFEVANFVILALLLGTYLVKTLPKTFRARNSAIQKDLADARTATEEAGIRLSGVEARLAKLDDEIAAMKDKAEKDSALDEQRIKANVEEEKKKILAAAEQDIAAATTHAQRQIQKYAAELAIEQAARKLVISAETDRLLVQNFARRLGGDDSKDGQN
jgi:F-type H+-transporting ATPase subunit b